MPLYCRRHRRLSAHCIYRYFIFIFALYLTSFFFCMPIIKHFIVSVNNNNTNNNFICLHLVVQFHAFCVAIARIDIALLSVLSWPTRALAAKWLLHFSRSLAHESFPNNTITFIRMKMMAINCLNFYRLVWCACAFRSPQRNDK